jgi:hypothetical protein
VKAAEYAYNDRAYKGELGQDYSGATIVLVLAAISLIDYVATVATMEVRHGRHVHPRI